MSRKWILYAWRLFIIFVSCYALSLHLWWLTYAGPEKWWSWEWDLYWALAYVLVMVYALLPRK